MVEVITYLAKTTKYIYGYDIEFPKNNIGVELLQSLPEVFADLTKNYQHILKKYEVSNGNYVKRIDFALGLMPTLTILANYWT